MKTLKIYIILFFVLFSQLIYAQNKKDTEVSASFKDSLSKALEIEKENYKDLRSQLSEDRKSLKRSNLEQNTYKLQYSTYANLLLIPETSVKSIEKAYTDHLATLDSIKSDIKSIEEKKQQVENDISRTEEQISINNKQLGDLRKARRTKENLRLIQGYTKLLSILNKKLWALKRVGKINKTKLNNRKELEKEFISLSKKFEESIQRRKKKYLLQRNMYSFKDGKALASELGKIGSNFSQLFKSEFWVKETEFIRKAGLMNLITFFGLYLVVFIILYQIKRFLNLHKESVLLNGYWPDLLKRILEKSFIMFSLVIYLFLFTHSGVYYSKNLMITSLLYILSLFLFTKWLLIFVKELKIKVSFDDKALTRLRIFIYIVRIYGCISIFGNWIYIENNIFFLVGRLIFVSVLFAWNFWFWKDMKNFLPEDTKNKKNINIILNIIKYLLYTVFSVSIVADITGFGTFGFYWLVSWARTSIVVLWASIFVFGIIELSKKEEEEEKKPKQSYDTQSHKVPVYWFVSRLGSIVLFLVIFISIVYAWGGKETILLNIYAVFKKEFTIGSWKISIMYFSLALISLILTNAVAKLWRQFFNNTFLKESGIDLGVQESVSMISFYLVWFIGILISLNFFGVSMKSVTVLFGALGIGLGFGLQAIFNNFISGIILLFERPIQVGDDLELDGTLATVKKINVRSTVVQTYDNATLIIPNSDFISTKVTNWSFKDKRIRRKVAVGVAYGSDTELVKETLMEVAKSNPHILNRPAAYVMFNDFGDSALIFTIRFWTTVYHFQTVETEVRFEIDRLFRERGIEISFPQRDIHIKSINSAMLREIKDSGRDDSEKE